MVHVPLMFLSEWLEFPWVPCLEKKKKGKKRRKIKLDDSSRLHGVEIVRNA